MAQYPAGQRGINNSAFSPNPDKVAQMTGTGANIPGTVVPTLASTIALDSYAMYSNFFSITNTAGVSAVTVTIGLIGQAGAHLVVQFNQYSGGSGALTFGTGFRPNGTLTPGSTKSRLVHFVSDGTTYNEVARTGADI